MSTSTRTHHLPTTNRNDRRRRRAHALARMVGPAGRVPPGYQCARVQPRGGSRERVAHPRGPREQSGRGEWECVGRRDGALGWETSPALSCGVNAAGWADSGTLEGLCFRLEPSGGWRRALSTDTDYRIPTTTNNRTPLTAQMAGLVPFGDWVCGWAGGPLHGENAFYDLVETVSQATARPP